MHNEDRFSGMIFFGSGGGGSAPKPVTPGEAAQAAVGTAGAGEMMAIANQPVEQYANLATMSALGAPEMQSQQALQGQAALQAAMQQQDMVAAVAEMARQQQGVDDRPIDARARHHQRDAKRLRGIFSRTGSAARGQVCFSQSKGS